MELGHVVENIGSKNSYAMFNVEIHYRYLDANANLKGISKSFYSF
jgi:hypothetical protein